MKKLFYFLSFSAFLAVSCSSDGDSDSDNPSTGNRLSKEIEHFDDGTSITYNYNYNGNKLASITDTEGETANFTYTGDLITNIKYYDQDGIYQEDFYSYNASGQLIEFVMLSYGVDWGHRETFVYNTDGSITTTHYQGDLELQIDQNNSGVLTFLSNGEIGAMTFTDDISSTYTYDTMNNETKNVLGYGKISFANSEASGINHNITSQVLGSSTSTTTYTYNEAGYPVTSTEIYMGETTTIEYFYE